MNEQTPSDDLGPLRDADPAADVRASDALRARIAEIPRARGTRPASRRRWFAPVAAAAAIVTMLGGAYIWSTNGLTPAPSPTPLAVGAGSSDEPAPPIVLGPAAGGAFVETQLAEMQARFSGPRPLGAHRFVIPPLDTAASTAPVWAFEGESRYSAEETSRIATAVSLSGEVRESEVGGWIVGDHGSAYFMLNDWGGSYTEGVPHPVTVCEEQFGDKTARANDPGFGQHMLRCMAEMPSPSDDDVRAAMVRFLTAIGIDPDQTQITVRDEDGDTTVGHASANLVIDGNVTDITAGIAVTAQGIMSAQGPIGSVVALGEYPIVSPADAALRLSDLAWAASSLSDPTMWSGEVGHLLPPSTPAPAPTPGAAIPWSIGVHEITEVRLGLASVFGDDGTHYLVPAYEFTASDDTVWSVIALADEALEETPVG